MSSRHLVFAGFLTMAAAPVLVSPVLAAPRDDVKAGSERCDVFTDDRTWLDCYYGAAQPMRAKLGLQPAPPSQQNLVPAFTPGAYPAAHPGLTQTVAAPPVEKPGFFTRLMTPTTQKPGPPTRMTSYKFDANGRFTVTLANGEVWRQVLGDSRQARWRNQPATYVVVIMPGTELGEQQMKVGKDEVYQVKLVP
jgi:hypothetical protein